MLQFLFGLFKSASIYFLIVKSLQQELFSSKSSVHGSKLKTICVFVVVLSFLIFLNGKTKPRVLTLTQDDLHSIKVHLV